VSIQLRQCLFFKNLSQEKIEALVDSMKKVEFAAGEVVIRQGDIG
jgi:CRP-like cAMP-binding protein